VRYLARDWVAKGHSVTVYCRTREDGRRKWTTEGVRCIWTPGWDTKSVSTLTFGATGTVDAALRNFDAALVVNVANGFFLPLLRLRGISTVVNTDGIEWERGKWGTTARRVFRTGAALTARYADVLVADSQAIAAIWQDTFGVESVFIPYGAPVVHERSSDRIEALGLSPRNYVLAVARLIPENNVELLLDALELLVPRPPAVIVGSANFVSPLEQRLRDADQHRLLRWLGHVSDQELLGELWSNAGAYVHGHSVGGTNPGLLQALGAGAPTLALDTPFNREVIERDVQLFPRDAQALSEQIAALLVRRDLQDDFTLHGQQLVCCRYDWEDISARYLDTLVEARWRRAARA
jgi:glycosyltransferase involved in cell wall biosynthesis